MLLSIAAASSLAGVSAFLAQATRLLMTLRLLSCRLLSAMTCRSNQKGNIMQRKYHITTFYLLTLAVVGGILALFY